MTRHFNHKIQQTSILAFEEELPNLGDRQREVLTAILLLNRQGIHPTDREIARFLQYADPNKIRPRRYELEEAELIMEAEHKTCTVTGKTAKSWVVSPVLPEKARKALIRMHLQPEETTITLSTDRYEYTKKVRVAP